MSLDVALLDGDEVLFDANITHNLTSMADAAGIYKAVWRPEECGLESAGQVADAISAGVLDMIRRPAHYEQFNPPNGWGSYERFVFWLVEYLVACSRWPNATISVSR